MFCKLLLSYTLEDLKQKINVEILSHIQPNIGYHLKYPGVNILRKSANSSGTVFSYTKNSTVTKLSNLIFVLLLQRYLAKDSVLIL